MSEGTRAQQKALSNIGAAEAREALYLKNQCDSPLLRLPAELRNTIYGYVLGGLDIVASNSSSWNLIKVLPMSAGPEERGKFPRNFLSIVQSCRQAHSESARLPFVLNTFILTTLDACPSQPFLHFIENILTEWQRNEISMIRIAFRAAYNWNMAELHKRAMADNIKYASYLAASIVDRSTRRLLLILKNLKFLTIDSYMGLDWPEDQMEQELLSKTDFRYKRMTEALVWVNRELGRDSVSVTFKPNVRYSYIDD